MGRKEIVHDPHPPFIRIADWHRDDHSQWMAAKSYCSICRRRVFLRFEIPEGEDIGIGKWVHADTNLEHDDERGGGGEP